MKKRVPYHKQILVFLSLIFLLVGIPNIFAEESHITLLAVSEVDDNGTLMGNVADLYLEVLPGKGRVLLDTQPISKLDTQLSTRYAKQAACKFLDINCKKQDFIYTIKSNAPIIGGPSAGAAITAVTIANLKGLPIKQDVAITGTINSGGFVGSVGGVKEKIEAGKNAGMNKVIIPFGDTLHEEDNQTVDLKAFAEEIGIELVEASDIEEVLYHITGTSFKQEIPDINIDTEYKHTMEELAKDLCSRTTELVTKLEPFEEEIKQNETTNSTYENAINQTKKGEEAYANTEFYAGASYCFGANVNLHNLYLNKMNISKLEIYERYNQVKDAMYLFEEKIDKQKYVTITDLQTYMVVKERLAETEDLLKNSHDALERIDNRTRDQLKNQTLNKSEQGEMNKRDIRVARYQLTFAIERLYSAKSWSTFFDTGGAHYEFNQDIMRESCELKILEANERFQYVKLFIPIELSVIQNEINDAKEAETEDQYEVCLFKASKAKARINLLTNAMSLRNNTDEFIEIRLNKIKEVITEEVAKERFPIVGYSYYEYANALKADDEGSSLLYAEYALELSDMDVYFERKGDIEINKPAETSSYMLIILFFFGISLGVILGIHFPRRK